MPIIYNLWLQRNIHANSPYLPGYSQLWRPNSNLVYFVNFQTSPFFFKMNQSPSVGKWALRHLKHSTCMLSLDTHTNIKYKLKLSKTLKNTIYKFKERIKLLYFKIKTLTDWQQPWKVLSWYTLQVILCLNMGRVSTYYTKSTYLGNKYCIYNLILP